METKKEKKIFSRQEFDKQMKEMINNPSFKVETVSVKNNEVVKTDVYPTKEFRTVIKKVLTDFGVDKQEAETVLEGYQFGNVSGLYPLISSSIMEYCKSGKKFNFLTENDLKASLALDKVEKTTKEYSAIKKAGDTTPAEKFNVTTESHWSLKSSGKAPKWLKKKFK